MGKILSVTYNNQVDNFEFKRIKPTGQCGYTSACMLLSYFVPEAGNDVFLGTFVEEMDKDFIAGKSNTRMGASLPNYVKMINTYLKKHNVHKECKIRPHSGSHAEIQNIIDSGSPLMVSTMMTTSGHYICIIGYDDQNYIVHDPFGIYSWTSKTYVKIGGNNGKQVSYPIAGLQAAMERSSRVAMSRNGFRYLWVE